VLVKIAGMDNPPKQFVAGSDALAVIKPALEARLKNCAPARIYPGRLMAPSESKAGRMQLSLENHRDRRHR